MGFFWIIDRIISGTKRSSDQSPPPITFPTQTVAILISDSAKKEDLQLDTSISVAALLEL